MDHEPAFLEPRRTWVFWTALLLAAAGLVAFAGLGVLAVIA